MPPRCIRDDRFILYTQYWTAMPAIQREKVLASIMAEYVKFNDCSFHVKDAWGDSITNL